MVKMPEPPPKPYAVLYGELLAADRQRFVDLITSSYTLPQEYVDWEWVKYHEPPQGISREEWWFLIKYRRQTSSRITPFTLTNGQALTWTNPDILWTMVDEVTSQAKGSLELPAGTDTFRKPHGFLISSLMEEAITSSQMEGASTSRAKAKEMLREGRKATDRSEQMILNNFEVMSWLKDIKDQVLTPELVCEIHRRITQGTLDDPADAGRIQQPGEERVRIYGTHSQEQILHIPPKAEELPERLERLCAFANGQGTEYVPPVVRSIILHFMLGYDHYFTDGNGRTARAVFYWSLLNQKFFLAEFLSISRLLKKKPGQYARSFIRTEQDEGDLTYFLVFHVRTLLDAIAELYEHIRRKTLEQQEFVSSMSDDDLNMRQMHILKKLTNLEMSTVSVASYGTECRVAPQTARTDLQDLTERGYLIRRKDGRKHYWVLAQS